MPVGYCFGIISCNPALLLSASASEGSFLILELAESTTFPGLCSSFFSPSRSGELLSRRHIPLPHPISFLSPVLNFEHLHVRECFQDPSTPKRSLPSFLIHLSVSLVFIAFFTPRYLQDLLTLGSLPVSVLCNAVSSLEFRAHLSHRKGGCSTLNKIPPLKMTQISLVLLSVTWITVS